jgi:hypothetical protein
MARATDKSARGPGQNPDTASSVDSSKGTASAALKSSDIAKTSDAKSDGNVASFQSGQYEVMRAILDKRSEDGADRPGIVREFGALWLSAHAVDLELLAPALEQAGVDEDKRSAVKVRKDLLNILLADLLRDGDEMMQAKLEALADALEAVEKAVEQERAGLGEEVNGLGQKMKDRFERLKRRFADVDDGAGEAMDLLAPRSLSVFPMRQPSRREPDMARYSSNSPDRDERGRFVSDDDRGSSRGGRGRGEPDRDESGRFASEGRSSRGRYDDEDSRSRDRDDSGRFVSEGRSSRSRDDDDDRSRGQSRWRDDEHESDRRYASRGRHDDERHEGRSRGGWFGDSEGHSEASRQGWRDSDHGDSGWYGDSERHSEAARRGWEGGHRSQRRDEDEGRRESQSRQDDYYRGRSRDDDDRRNESGRGSRSDDDDDRRSSSRGRGHSGWSGDPEGHSEASRRGWENRR